MATAPPSPTPLLTSLSRHQNHLQTHIQSLLDAQSAALLSGLGHDDFSSVKSVSSGTGTPTSTTARSPSLTSSYRNHTSPTRHHTTPPLRRTTSKPLSLNNARREIGRVITDLTTLKSQESEILSTEFDARTQDVALIDSITTKQDGLRDAISSISAQESTQKLAAWREEERGLGNEIQELEDRLAQMKARRGYLLREIRGLESSVGANLSSYTESLRLSEKEAAVCLSRVPDGARGKEEGSIWALPKERRTLGMAREWAGAEREIWKKRVERCEKERVALVEGGKVWKNVCEVVESVERGLRAAMKGGGGGIKGVVGDMETAGAELERCLGLAEERGWRLLVCCVGAELGALVEGMEVLRGALDASYIDNHRHEDEQYTDEDDLNDKDREGDLLGNKNTLDDLSGSMNGVSIRATGRTHETPQKSEDEDDGPGPDLLISHLEEE